MTEELDTVDLEISLTPNDMLPPLDPNLLVFNLFDASHDARRKKWQREVFTKIHVDARYPQNTVVLAPAEANALQSTAHGKDLVQENPSHVPCKGLLENMSHVRYDLIKPIVMENQSGDVAE